MKLVSSDWSWNFFNSCKLRSDVSNIQRLNRLFQPGWFRTLIPTSRRLFQKTHFVGDKNFVDGYIDVNDGCWSRKYCHQHHCSRQQMIFVIIITVVLFSGAFKCDICEKMFTAVWSLNDRNYQATKISRHIKSKIHQNCSQLKFTEMFTSESL